MKKLKIVVPFLLLAALVLTGAMCEKEKRERKKEKEEEEEEEEEKLEDYTLYENKKWDFKIYYPKDWEKEIVVDDPDGVMVGFTSPEEDPEDYLLENVVVVAAEPDPYEDFDEMATEMINGIQEDEYLGLVDYSKEMIAGYPGYKIIFTEETYEGELKYLYYCMNAGETWYLILYTAGKDTYSKYFEQVETMIDTFEITK